MREATSGPYGALMTKDEAPSLLVIQRAAIQEIRDYLTKDDGLGTERLRKVAALFIDAREHFYTQDGSPDWLGRTYAYRRWVRETTTEAGVPSATLSTLQASIRYHSGSVLRERLNAETLEDLGLRPESPRERSVEKRQHAAETLQLFGHSGGAEITTPDEVAQVGRIIAATLHRIAPEAFRAMPAEQREALREAMRVICDEPAGGRRRAQKVTK